MQHKSETKRWVFVQIICDVHQTLFLFPSEPCCFAVKNVFCKSKMAAIKTLTDANRILKDITCMLLSVHKATMSLNTIGQPNFISMPDDSFKHLAM